MAIDLSFIDVEAFSNAIFKEDWTVFGDGVSIMKIKMNCLKSSSSFFDIDVTVINYPSDEVNIDHIILTIRLDGNGKIRAIYDNSMLNTLTSEKIQEVFEHFFPVMEIKEPAS